LSSPIFDILNKIENACHRCGRTKESVTLVAVSKKKPATSVISVFNEGITTFGENYIQEAVKKVDEINNNKISWHFIGHLQSKKSKFAVRYFDLIHSVDSLKLAKELNKQSEKINKIQNILVQVNIGFEETKSGIDPSETVTLINQIKTLKNIRVQGLMAMPPYYNEPEKVRPFFKSVKQIFENIKHENIENINMKELSMGMTGDFEVAIEEGATIVRIGTAIFGSRS